VLVYWAGGALVDRHEFLGNALIANDSEWFLCVCLLLRFEPADLGRCSEDYVEEDLALLAYPDGSNDAD
jgi:hypothetical protein